MAEKLFSAGRQGWAPWALAILAAFALAVWGVKITQPRDCACATTDPQRIEQNNRGSAEGAVKTSLALAQDYNPVITIPAFPASFWFVKNVKVS